MNEIFSNAALAIIVCVVFSKGTPETQRQTWWPSRCGTVDMSFVEADTVMTLYKCGEDSYTLINMKNDAYHGVFERWDKNGVLRSRIRYCQDRFCGEVRGWDSTGNLLTEKKYDITNKPVGLHRQYYSADRPKRFTNFNDNGDKHGWEIFWYDNGNVKDSILFRNDSTMQRRSYYYNGKPQMFEDDIYGTYDAVSFNPKGKRTGKIKDGTGAVFLCDSVGGDCKELKYKDGKRIVE